MKTMREYLAEAADVMGSVEAVYKHLGVSRSALSGARRSGSMDANHCIKLAEILEIDPAEILKSASIARDPSYAKIWKKYGTAAALVMALFAPYSEKNDDNQSVAEKNAQSYILC